MAYAQSAAGIKASVKARCSQIEHGVFKAIRRKTPPLCVGRRRLHEGAGDWIV
jgi:hypothetical protein